jgi:hypothetical protein
LYTPINPVFRLGLPRFRFFEIGASAIFKDQCSKAIVFLIKAHRKPL